MSARNPPSVSGSAPGKSPRSTVRQRLSSKPKHGYAVEVPRALGEALQTVKANLRTAARFMIDQLPNTPRRRQLEPTLADLDDLMDDIKAFRLLVDDLTNHKRVGLAATTELIE